MNEEEILQKVGLFQRLQAKTVRSLAKMATRRNYQPGQPIVTEGQMGLGLYCIESGRVKVSRNGPAGEQEIRTMGRGESFGELALLDDSPRSATITAIEPTSALLLDKAQFLAQLRTHPEMGLDLIPVLVKWLRDADRRTTETG